MFHVSIRLRPFQILLLDGCSVWNLRTCQTVIDVRFPELVVKYIAIQGFVNRVRQSDAKMQHLEILRGLPDVLLQHVATSSEAKKKRIRICASSRA